MTKSPTEKWHDGKLKGFGFDNDLAYIKEVLAPVPSYEEYMEILEQIAKENNLELTENAQKISTFRYRHNLPINICPCEQQAKDRGCIGSKCWEEINKDGICLCHCFKKHIDTN